MAHISQPRPDFDLGFRAKVCHTLQVVPSSLRGGASVPVGIISSASFSTAPLSSEHGTYTTVKARYRPCLSGKIPQKLFSFSLWARERYLGALGDHLVGHDSDARLPPDGPLLGAAVGQARVVDEARHRPHCRGVDHLQVIP